MELDSLTFVFGMGVGVIVGFGLLYIFEEFLKSFCRKRYSVLERPDLEKGEAYDQFGNVVTNTKEVREAEEAEEDWNCLPRCFPCCYELDNSRHLEDITSEQLENAFVDSGVIEDINVIVAIDVTTSNKFKGRRTFGGKNLHEISKTLNDHKALKSHSSDLNPYERCILAAERFLRTDHDFPLYYFGSVETADAGGFLHVKDCQDTEDLWMTYRETIGTQTLSGPGRFLPLMERAMERVKSLGRYHILLILTDGDIEDEAEFGEALTKASAGYPLSIVVVGIGDGPFHQAEKFDDYMPEGKHFDNLQFVSFDTVRSKISLEAQKKEFFVQAFNEIPRQYETLRQELGYRAPVRRTSSFEETNTMDWVSRYDMNEEEKRNLERQERRARHAAGQRAPARGGKKAPNPYLKSSKR